jgi:rare lipoprotein A
MRLRCIIAFSLAALALASGARADQLWADSADAVDLTATGPQKITQLAAGGALEPTVSQAETAMPVPARLARLSTVKALAGTPAKHHGDRLADKSKSHGDKTTVPDARCVRAIGKAETGSAAWYGGRYVGRRTTSGSRLDTVSPTAAHRTLPLNSLARVTNLKNGRSVIVRVTDRGPVSSSLLIDMSPRAAAELQMEHAGVVPVKVEQVVEVPADPK